MHWLFILIKNFKMITIDGKKYATPAEYSVIKGKSLQTVYNWIKDNKIATRKIMKKTLIKV